MSSPARTAASPAVAIYHSPRVASNIASTANVSEPALMPDGNLRRQHLAGCVMFRPVLSGHETRNRTVVIVCVHQAPSCGGTVIRPFKTSTLVPEDLPLGALA